MCQLCNFVFFSLLGMYIVSVVFAFFRNQLLNEAGQNIGIGDFRPEKRGPFGTFRVTEFKARD